MRFSIDQITGNGLRPRRPRVQAGALICWFNLDVAKENRAACFRIDVGAPANINARINHLAESETVSLKNAHAAAGAAAGRQRAAKELLSAEIPEGQTLGGHQYRTHLRDRYPQITQITPIQSKISQRP